METTFHSVADDWYGTLYAAIDATQTSLVIAGAGVGAEPDAPFYFDIDAEQIKCTAVTADTPGVGQSTLTVTRAQNGTSGAVHAEGAAVAQNNYAEQLTELQEAVNAAEAVWDGNVEIGGTAEVAGGFLDVQRVGGANQSVEIEASSSASNRIRSASPEANKKTFYIDATHDETGTPSGALGILLRVGGVSAPVTTLQIDDDGDVNILTNLVLASSPPASATASGVAGTIAWDNGYIYICVATDTWKRVAIATW